MHPERRGGGDPGRQSSLPSNLRSLLIDNPEHGGQSEHPEASTSGEPRAGWDPSSRAFRPVPSFPDPDYNVGSLAPAAFDEGDRRIGDLPRRGPAEPIETYSDDPYLRRPAAPQLPPLQSILPGGTSPTEPALPPPRSVHGYPQHLSLPPPEPPRLPTLRPYWEGQAGPSSQPQRLPPARHGYSYPMPQAHEPAAPYSHPPPQLTPVSSSFPPPGSRYGGHHELGGEYPVASSSRQPLQPYPESYSFPQPGPSRAYEAGRGRIPEARSEYGSPTLGYLRRHLEPEGGGHPDDPRRGRSLPPRRSAGASGSRPLPSRLLEPEDRGLYPLPHAPPLPYSRGSPVTAERPGEGERQLSPVEFRTRPGSRRSVSPSERRTALPIPEAERPPLQRYESVPDFRAPSGPGFGHGARPPFPLSFQSSTQYDPATMAPRYPVGARLPVSTPYSYDPNAPPLGEVETVASPRYTGPLFSEPRSYQPSLTSHSTHSGDDGNDTEDSVSRRGPEEDAPPEPGPSRRTSRKRRRAEDVEAGASRAGSPSRTPGESPEPPRKQSKKTEKACFFCRKRKLRCDGQPLCGNCAKRQVACKYPPGRPKRRGPGKKNLAKQQAQAQAPLPPLSGQFTFQPPDPYYPPPDEEAAMYPHAMFRHDPPMPVPPSPGRPPGSGSRGRPSEERHFSLGPLGESLGSEYSVEDVPEEGSGGQGTDEEEDDGSTPPER